jgi:transcription elongation factor GreB
VSKAFTRESDENESVVLPVRAPLPAGVKNYVTPAGAQRLSDELDSLLAAISPSGPGREPDHLREARIRQLQTIIPTLSIAEPPAERDTIRFGASVKLKRQGEVENYRLVGIDETDIDRNEISWLSPLGKVLVGKRAGDHVSFRSPAGLEELTILSITYD